MVKKLVRWQAAATIVAAGAVLAGSSGTAWAASSVAISPNPSVYGTAGCKAFDNQPGSRNYRNSEVEPWVTVDPTNSAHLVSAWQQDRWSNGGAHGLASGYSTDGGRTWTVSPQPFSVCWKASGYTNADGFLDYQRASDPWVSVGPGSPGNAGGNTVYSVSLSFDQTPYGADVNAVDNAVGAAVSYNNGADWSHVQTIIADPCVHNSPPQPGYTCNSTSSFVFNDKESVTADPNTPGTAYAIWDRVVAPPGNLNREHAFFGQTFISKTTDFGASWSFPKALFKLPSQQQTIGNQIVINRQNGTLYDFFDLIRNNVALNTGTQGYRVAFSKSTDGGNTWTAPQVINSLESLTGQCSVPLQQGVCDANNYNPYTDAPPAPSRTGDIIPEPAINPSNGQLYVVWQDARFNGNQYDEIAISTSSDGGTSWSAPARVNDSNGHNAYNPAVYVNSSGTVGVTYDQWSTTTLGNEPTTLFIKKSTAAGSSASAPTFPPASPVSGPFNNLAAPVARGYFLGDYHGLVYGSRGWTPVYVITNCSDGNATTQPSCRAIQSVLPHTNRAPTDNNSTDTYAFPGS